MYSLNHEYLFQRKKIICQETYIYILYLISQSNRVQRKSIYLAYITRRSHILYHKFDIKMRLGSRTYRLKPRDTKHDVPFDAKLIYQVDFVFRI